MAEARKPTQRYLSGRVKIAGTEALSSDRHLYVDPGQVEPNLGYVGEKDIPLSDQYYQLVTIPNGGTYDRYWQAQGGLIPGGVTIFDEGVQVGVANSVTKLNFVGAVVNATVSGSISTISLAPSSRVAVGTEPPGSVLNGDLWWSSSVGELYVYYEDGDSNQWVETAGGSETVTISDTAPPDANSGDLWWESDDSRLKVFYNSEWVDTNPWLTNSVGVHTSVNIGIGTTNPTSSLTVKGNTSLETLNVSGISTFSDDADFQNVSVGGTLSLSGAGSQFFAFNEDTVKVKFANWYSSNDRQYGMGQLWFETWFAAIDDNPSQSLRDERRIGFYLEQPNNGSSDSGGTSNLHPTNDRMHIDINGVFVRNNFEVSGDANVSGISTFQSDVNVGVDTSTGVILTSPNGTQYRLIVDDSGNLGTVAV
jgi:hypothetical protein